MALLTGAGGAIHFSSFGGVVGRTWSATVSRAVIDTTGFGNWQKNRDLGRLDITGTVTGVLESTSTPWLWAALSAPATIILSAGASSTATGTSVTGHSISFPAIVDRCDVGVDVSKETADVTYNFSMASSVVATSFVFSNLATTTWT